MKIRRLISNTIGAVTLVTLFGALYVASANDEDPPNLNLNPEPISMELKRKTSFASVVKKTSPSVVYITTMTKVEQPRFSFPFKNPFFEFDERFGRNFEDDRRREEPQFREQQGLGSGVIVSENGYILTNNHVIQGADEIEVRLSEGGRAYSAEVLGSDPHTDIAVIKVDASDLPAIIMTDSDNLEVGDTVLAIGNPFGVFQSVTSGIVSGTGRNLFGIVNVENFIQTDASINPGNSGGALVDAEGRLVGINTFIMSRTGGNQGIGFAIPVNLVRGVMDQIVQFGDVQRGLLGVSLQPLTETLAEAFDLPDGEGVLIGEVGPNSPAEDAGIEAGDVIVEYNDEKVSDIQQLKLLVAETRPDTEVDIGVIRDNERKTIEVTIGRLPQEGYASVFGQRGQSRKDRGTFQSGHDALDGVTVTDLTNTLRQQFNIPRHVEGVVVTEVEPGCPADVEGLKRGDIIMAIEREPVESAEEAIELSERIKKQKVLLRVRTTNGSRYMVVDAEEDRRR